MPDTQRPRYGCDRTKHNGEVVPATRRLIVLDPEHNYEVYRGISKTHMWVSCDKHCRMALDGLIAQHGEGVVIRVYTITPEQNGLT